MSDLTHFLTPGISVCKALAHGRGVTTTYNRGYNLYKIVNLVMTPEMNL
eukprot:COSAG02_NODE_50_length_44860_cov_203.992739_41_plen_49_part_00